MVGEGEEEEEQEEEEEEQEEQEEEGGVWGEEEREKIERELERGRRMVVRKKVIPYPYYNKDTCYRPIRFDGVC